MKKKAADAYDERILSLVFLHTQGLGGTTFEVQGRTFEVAARVSSNPRMAGGPGKAVVRNGAQSDSRNSSRESLSGGSKVWRGWINLAGAGVVPGSSMKRWLTAYPVKLMNKRTHTLDSSVQIPFRD